MFIFAGLAMAFDVAISTQAGWYSQGAADREMDELVAAIEGNPSIGSVDVFTDAEQDALATWVTNHTSDGNADILILNGQFPDTIYEPGNTQADDSLAEMYLDAGNAIFNTGDYMFYVVNSGGTNAAGGLETMMDIPGTSMWDDDTPVMVTADGAAYTPTVVDFNTDRPFHLDELDGGWEPLVIMAQNDAGTRADPAVVINTNTGGMLGIFYQTASQDDDPRSEVIGEFINSYYSTTAVSPLEFSPVCLHKMIPLL
jgi:hypothetical protein